MVIHANAKNRNRAPIIPPLPDIVRVEGMNILGVFIDHNLSVSIHVNNVCQKSAQCLYALKLVHAHGLNTISLHDVCNAMLVANLTYCINAWWGFTNAVDKQKLQAVLNRAARRAWFLESKLFIFQ